MAELGWREAIVRALQQNNEPMHYAAIAEFIAANGLKKKFGATPAASVAAAISGSLQSEDEDSPFIKVSRGVYALKATKKSPVGTTISDKEEKDETGFINAFGMYWRRDYVFWAKTPKLLGQQQPASQPVDFHQQKGVYLLHDGSKVVYVGRTTEQPLGMRLKQHTLDRLNGRWDRFSWFGIFGAQDDGNLSQSPGDTFNIENLIATMEALLIEGLEPPQNRKRGDEFTAVEFLQVEDPEIKKGQTLELLEKVKKTLQS